MSKQRISFWPSSLPYIVSPPTRGWGKYSSFFSREGYPESFGLTPFLAGASALVSESDWWIWNCQDIACGLLVILKLSMCVKKRRGGAMTLRWCSEISSRWCGGRSLSKADDVESVKVSSLSDDATFDISTSKVLALSQGQAIHSCHQMTYDDALASDQAGVCSAGQSFLLFWGTLCSMILEVRASSHPGYSIGLQHTSR